MRNIFLCCLLLCGCVKGGSNATATSQVDNTQSNSGCLDKLKNGGDSFAHQVLNLRGSALNPDMAVATVMQLKRNLGCSDEEVNLPLENSSCHVFTQSKNGTGASTACYVDNAEGMFFVTRDLLGGLNIIYQRWD